MQGHALLQHSNETIPDTLDSVQNLARRFGRQVFESAYRVLGNRAQAEDVQQEVFLQLLQASHSDTAPAIQSWQKYLCAAASRRAIDVLRKQHRWWQMSAWWRESAIEGAPELDGPEQSLTSVQQAQALRTAIAKLPAREAQCFALRYLNDMNIADIAQGLAIDINAVNVSLHRARKRLHQTLAAQHDRDTHNGRKLS
jgi:RNA polymerase sigma factor (sigma-70 family)